MTTAERSEMYRRIEEWNIARHLVDQYVKMNYPFTPEQIVEFMALESKVFSAALKLREFCTAHHLH